MKKNTDIADKVKILSEALPYIRRYHGRTIVVKYGGNAMANAELKAAFARDIALLKLVGVNPVVVHGGGPQINEILNRIGKESRFIGGLRCTDGDTMQFVEMALGGLVNKEIVQLINDHGGRAVGLTGKDGGLIRAKKIRGKKGGEIGRVGVVSHINPQVVELLDAADFIPVIAPIGVDDKGESLNINADSAAGRLAVELRAEMLLLLTNTAGVLNRRGELISELSSREAKRLMKSGVIADGMRPKVECAIEAIGGGVGSCRIINGAILHPLLLELFTEEGAGTLITS